MVVPNWSENQNSMPHVMSVDTLPSRIAGHALSNPMLIAESSVRPARSSSFMRLEYQDVGIHRHTHRQYRRGDTDSVSVTGRILKMASSSAA